MRDWIYYATLNIGVVLWQSVYDKNIWKQGLWEGGFNRYIGPGPEEPRKDPWISEGPHSLAIDVLFWFFSLYFWYF
jgi:hypothetical protein